MWGTRGSSLLVSPNISIESHFTTLNIKYVKLGAPLAIYCLYEAKHALDRRRVSASFKQVKLLFCMTLLAL